MNHRDDIYKGLGPVWHLLLGYSRRRKWEAYESMVLPTVKYTPSGHCEKNAAKRNEGYRQDRCSGKRKLKKFYLDGGNVI